MVVTEEASAGGNSYGGRMSAAEYGDVEFGIKVDWIFIVVWFSKPYLCLKLKFLNTLFYRERKE